MQEGAYGKAVGTAIWCLVIAAILVVIVLYSEGPEVWGALIAAIANGG